MVLMSAQMLALGVEENKGDIGQPFRRINWKNLKEHLLEHTIQMFSPGKKWQ